MILLTDDEAAIARDMTFEGAELRPVALLDGSAWILPSAVLSDPAYASAHDYLATLPRRHVDPSEWLVEP